MSARAQRATEPPPPQERSAPARPEFAWERFAFIAKELPPLFLRHWEEIALNQKGIRLDPHWDRYYQLDAAEILRILTVRVDSELVGYHFVLVFPHLHYFSTMSADTDMFWLAPEHRKGRTGYDLLKIVRDTCRESGVKQHHLRTKLHIKSFEPLLKRLGYRPIETNWSQVWA